MPYEMVFEWKDGRVNSIKPLAPNNPEYDFEHIKIFYRGQFHAKSILKISDDLNDCYVRHYDV